MDLHRPGGDVMGRYGPWMVKVIRRPKMNARERSLVGGYGYVMLDEKSAPEFHSDAPEYRSGVDMRPANSRTTCTRERHGRLLATPQGIVLGMTPEGWWSPPTSHRPAPNQGAEVVVHRWLDDKCQDHNGGHQWTVTQHDHAELVPLPRSPGQRLFSPADLQAAAERTREGAPGGLQPVWAWWLWILGRVEMPVDDALCALEQATHIEKGGLSRPQGEPAWVHLTSTTDLMISGAQR